MNCAQIYSEGLAINSVMPHLPAAYSKSLVLTHVTGVAGLTQKLMEHRVTILYT
jgi:hypothetical protein